MKMDLFKKNSINCLDKNLPIYKAQGILQPECTVIVHEDCKIVQQRSRWVGFCPNKGYPPMEVMWLMGMEEELISFNL
jgi:hypothetical protein